MDYRRFISDRRGGGPGPEGPPGGDIGQLLFVTARPGIQALWTILVAATLIYTLAGAGPKHAWALVLMGLSYAAVVAGNHWFPHDRYHPVLFILLMCASLTLISSIVFLTGNRESLLGFLFFMVPIFAAAYLGYPGTMLVAALTAMARFGPFVAVEASGMQYFSLALTAFAYFALGLVARYVFEGGRMYARESEEYRHLLEVAMDKERDVSLIYNLSRRFSYSLDLDTVLQTTAALARRMLSVESALVFLLEEGQPVLKAALGTRPSTDIPAVRLPADEGWVKQLLAGNDVIADMVDFGWLPLPGGSDRFKNMIAVPLFTGVDVAGYLVCVSPPPRGFKDADLEVLSTLASQAAVAVEKARLYTHTLNDKAKVETILGALRDGLLVTDAEGVLVQTNPVAERMLGLDGSAVGDRLLDVLAPVMLEADLGGFTTVEAVAAVLGGRSIFGEAAFATEPRVNAQLQFIPLVDQASSVSGMVLFLHDITELKRIDEMKSNFVTNVSHELRTPLTSISGFVSLLLAGRAGALGTQQKKYLKVVSRQAANLTRMIEDLLDLSRLQSRQVKPNLSSADVRAVVDAVIEDLQEAASAKNVDITARVSAGLPPVQADPDRLSQVLGNIVGNAIKFSGKGGLVEITAHRNGPLMQVQVSDSGSGIPSSALPYIFDRFYQGGAGEMEEDSGFGLGLAISREIVEMHGGKIWAESDPGRGSIFYFTLPVKEMNGRLD
jgi:two-component system, OmpR family, phosphate regulon sensor histidine kinase PhoR